MRVGISKSFIRSSLESWIAVLLVVMGFTGCSSAEEQEGAEPPPVPVVITEVKQETVPIIAEYVARTEADSTVEIRARVEGVLAGIFFDDGTRVKKGQLLFQIEPAPYEAALRDAEAKLAKAEAALYLAQKNVELVKSKAGEAQPKAQLAKADQFLNR